VDLATPDGDGSPRRAAGTRSRGGAVTALGSGKKLPYPLLAASSYSAGAGKVSMVDVAAEGSHFESKLPSARERFLAHCIEHALEIELRGAADFIRHFPPHAIMRGLANQPELRAQMLVLTTGVRHKIAVRKSAESAGEDLQIALDEGETDPESIVAIFDPDDRVRYLDASKLWSFCVEGEFWKASPANHVETDRARRQIAFVIERALAEALITHRDVVEAIGVAELATRLPRSELGKLVERALDAGHRGTPFTESELLAMLPPAEIVRHVPLPHVWENVVVARVAARHGFVAPPPEARPDAAAARGDPPAAPASLAEVDAAGAAATAVAAAPAGTAVTKAASPAPRATAPRAATATPAPKAAAAPAGPAGKATSATATDPVAAAWSDARELADFDDDAPVIESLPPDPSSDSEVTDDDIRIT